MRTLTSWTREYVPGISAADNALADDLTLRGIAVEGVFDLGTNGSLFEMDITTNRVDAMNHYGIAREAATIYGLQLRPLEATLPPHTSAQPYSVTVDEPTLCGRFTARVLRNVTIKPSTGIVAERFRLLEQKLISNAVDATNYVTLAMGHPTHAFDLDKLSGGIVLRRARKGEKLRTLDGIERTLDPEDLVVADEKKALALAGVIGGWDSRVTEETKNILVEAAWFDPVTIRRSSKRHLIHTDASHRFERGADFNAPPIASALVSRIILEAGGHQEGELVDVVIPESAARTANRAGIAFSVGEARRILGATEDPAGITAADSETILTGLGCSLEQQAEGAYQVTLPSWRLDLEREIDLIEEVARVYGYNRFRNTLPSFAGSVVELPWAAKESALRRTMLALGFSEAVSSTFVSAADAAVFAPQPGSFVPLGNPLSEEAGVLRPSLAPDMLAMLALNLNRDVADAALFEIGTVFSGSTDRVEERSALCLGLTGSLGASVPLQPEHDADFYDLKGAVEELLAKFASKRTYFDRFPVDSGLMPAWLHPGRSARAVVDGATVGYFGEVHPDEAARRKLKQTILLGELYLDRLYRQDLRHPMARELSRFQPVHRDFSFLLAESVSYAQVEEAVHALHLPELQSFTPKEVLRDPHGRLVPAGRYSLLLGTVLQSLERTMREEELQEAARHIIAAVESLGGRLRG